MTKPRPSGFDYSAAGGAGSGTAAPLQVDQQETKPPAPAAKWRRQAWIVAAVVTIVLVYLGYKQSQRVSPRLILSGHRGNVDDMAFSPDGHLLASASREDAAIRLWDIETGEMLSVFGRSKVNRVAFSPDGRILAASGQNALVTFWDVETGARLEETLDARSDSSGLLIGLEYSPDGRFLLTVQVGPGAGYSNDYPISLWDTQTWQLIQRWDESDGQFDFSPDGSTLIVATGATFKENDIIWSLESQEEVGRLEWGGDDFFRYSASGEGLVGWRANGDGELHFFDPESGKRLSTLPLAGLKTGDLDWFLKSVRFTTDGQRLITGDCKNALNLWDAADGSHLSKIQLSPSKRWENCLVPEISPDGSMLATAEENKINLWSLPEAFR